MDIQNYFEVSTCFSTVLTASPFIVGNLFFNDDADARLGRPTDEDGCVGKQGRHIETIRNLDCPIRFSVLRRAHVPMRGLSTRERGRGNRYSRCQFGLNNNHERKDINAGSILHKNKTNKETAGGPKQRKHVDGLVMESARHSGYSGIGALQVTSNQPAADNGGQNRARSVGVSGETDLYIQRHGHGVEQSFLFISYFLVLFSLVEYTTTIF